MSEDTTPADFIRTILADDQKAGKHGGRVQTRFPPEPNGYLHIGHAKSICLNFGLAAEFDGQCNLRFDDTNPAKEEVEYVNAIRENLRWLGFDWEDREFYASDYFGKLHDHAVTLIEKGAAFVCSLDAEQMREYRGTVHTTGKNSPDRDRSVEENLDLFARMRKGEFANGTYTLRAKIDMASSNINLRDPAIYRIRHEHHDRTGDDWPIYPMYDYAHCVSDSIEGITHSVCTLEFEHHRPLYDWYLDQLEIHHPQQIEFARLEVSYMMMSKRKLLSLVDDGVVDGWDDPRMPTLSGLRRRGFTPSAIRAFCERVGVAKFNATIEMALLEFCLREDLNKIALRRMAVLDPIKLVIENYPEGGCDELDAINNPEDESAGKRQIKFSKELYIERADFMEDAPKKYFRMTPGREVRLRYAFLVTCTGCEKDADGKITEVRATYDPETRGGSAPDGRKVKGTIHWVSKEHGLDAEVRLYDQLFAVENPAAEAADKPIAELINPDSLQVVQAKVEPCLADAKAGESIQFERTGYFCADSTDHTAAKPVFNRTVGLRDSWAKKQKKG